MHVLTTDGVAALCGGRAVGSATARGVSADSRTLQTGQAFVAVRGGHGFVAQAIGAGAAFAIVQDAAALPSGADGVIVDDTVAALGRLGAEARAAMDVRVVALTGSVGKTLTKDLVAAALEPAHRVYATPGNLNTDVGVPLVLLNAPDDVDVMVCELGARRPGEIDELARMVRPELGIVTGIGIAHLGAFATRDAIARTKAELLGALPPTGTAVVPASDDYLPLLVEATHARAITVGPGGMVRARDVAIGPDGRTSFVAIVGDTEVPVSVRIPGRPHVRNVLFALAAARRFDVDLAAAAAYLGRAATTGWRMQLERIGTWVVLNDVYNANPTSTAAALRTLRELAGDGDAWALLGVMADLGDVSGAEHLRIGRLAASLGVQLVAVGDASAVGPAAVRAETPEDGAAAVASRARPGATILVKGSRSAGMERAVQALRDAPDRSDV